MTDLWGVWNGDRGLGLGPCHSPHAFSSSNKTKGKKWIKTVSWGVADMAFRPKHFKGALQATFQPRQLKQGFPRAKRSTNNIYTVIPILIIISVCELAFMTCTLILETAHHMQKHSLCTQTKMTDHVLGGRVSIFCRSIIHYSPAARPPVRHPQSVIISRPANLSSSVRHSVIVILNALPSLLNYSLPPLF